MGTFARFSQFDSLDKGRDKDSDDGTTTDVADESVSFGSNPEATSDAARPDATSSSTLSVVGSTLVFKGELIADEDLLIQGQVHGTIEHNANNLTIGVHGNVKANIRARNILIQGEVHGNIHASERVVVESSARVRGDIFAPQVGLKEGAKFRGSIDMENVAGAKSASTSNADSDASRRSKNKQKGQQDSKSGTTVRESSAGSDGGTVSESVVDATLSGGMPSKYGTDNG